MIVIEDGELKSLDYYTRKEKTGFMRLSMFISRPDSKLDGVGVYGTQRMRRDFRKRMPGSCGQVVYPSSHFGDSGGDRLCGGIGIPLR